MQEIKGVEIDFIVRDSLEAFKLYESVFEVELIEKTALERGQNEVIFSIYGTRFHLLDENLEFGLVAPTTDKPPSFWFNVTVADIEKTHKAALDAKCKEIQPVTLLEDYEVSNSIFADKFGYVWMLHQVHKVMSVDEQMSHLGAQKEETDG